MKTNSKVSGEIPLDPKQISKYDLTEASLMLVSTATLLRQSFGIVNMVNSLLDEPLTQDELKSFGNQFSLVHSTVQAIYQSLRKYLDTLPD